MKIGIFNGGYMPTKSLSGGGATFQHTVLSTLAMTTSKHTFYFFCDDPVDTLFPGLSVVPWHRFCSSKNDSLVKKAVLKGFRFFDTRQVNRHYKSFLHRATTEHNIDMMWFLTPVFQPIDIPYIFTVWDLQHRLQPYFPEVSNTGSTYEERERMYGFMLPRAAYVVVGNAAGKEEIERFYGLPSWRVKINPLPTPQFAIQGGAGETIYNNSIKCPYLFYPAQFWPHKNHVVILHALKILREKYNQKFDVVFTGADKGNLSYVKEVVKGLGLENCVHFLGFVDQETLICLYKNAFAMVFASFFGPDNIPPLEAFSLGCPVIASRVSGSEYQLEGAALLFDPRSEYELADEIVRLGGDEILLQKLVAEGKRRVVQFSSNNYVENMLNLFDEFALIRRCWSCKDRYKHT